MKLNAVAMLTWRSNNIRNWSLFTSSMIKPEEGAAFVLDTHLMNVIHRTGGYI